MLNRTAPKTSHTLLAGAALALSLGAAALPVLAAGPAAKIAPDTTVVLVHGAFADGSSWNKVIPLLQAKGLKVVAVQNPLTSLADDVAVAQRAVDAATGNVVLVGHSWGGTVITQAGTSDKVKALVYVAALAPSVGENSADLGKDYPPTPGLATVKADAAGFLTMPDAAIAQHFAQDVSPAEAKLIAATQGPLQSKAFGEPVTVAAWKNKPNFYIVAGQDHMIQPALQQAFAKKLGATTVTLPTSHVPMVSKPRQVADVIIQAASAAR